MKNCTKHSIERWVQRIVGITTKQEQIDYIRDNSEQIKEHMNKTFEYSEFIYKGQVGDNITRNFYIKDDIVFVLNTTNDAIITVYKVDFGFTQEINLNVAKGLFKEVRRLLQEKEEHELNILSEVEDLEMRSNGLDEQIKVLEQQLKVLKESKKTTDEYIKSYKNSNQFVDLEIKKHLNNLVNSKEYKEDIKNA